MPVLAPFFAYIGTAVGASAATATATGVAVTATTASVAATGISAYTQYQAGKSQSALDNYNAQLAAQEGMVAGRDAANQANQQRDQGQRIMAKQRAIIAASGVVGETGSPLIAETEQAGYLERDALETERQGNIKAAQYDQQSILDRMQGGAARRAGDLNTYATILGGTSKAIGTYRGIA